MSYSRRQLYALGEPLGDATTQKKWGGGYIAGGGGSAPAQPTSSTVTQTTIPEWARPYAEKVMGKAEALTETPYQQYGGQTVAGFSPGQQQAFMNMSNMQLPGQTGEASDIASNVATQAGQRTPYNPLAATNQYSGPQYQHMGIGNLMTNAPQLQNLQMSGPMDVSTQKFTDPNVAQSYMNPYMQNVVNQQQMDAQRQDDIAMGSRNARAVASGAFGGSRQGMQEAEAARNLAMQKANIQATGSNAAYNQAQQAFMADQARQLQAAQANQNMGYNVGQQNLGANLQTQSLGAGQNMQSQLANQQAQLYAQGQGLTQNQQANQFAQMNAQLAAQYGLAGLNASEQSRQFGTNLDVQGLSQQLAAANQLGNLGQQQYGQMMGINAGQQQVGAQQQALEQQILNQRQADFATQQQYPYTQLGYLSNIVRGTPTGGSTQNVYQAPASVASQLGGIGQLGLGALKYGSV